MELDLTALSELAAKATPGPWKANITNFCKARVVNLDSTGWPQAPVAWLDEQLEPGEVARCGANHSNADNDARFIAAAREAIPVLVARVHALEARWRFES